MSATTNNSMDRWVLEIERAIEEMNAQKADFMGRINRLYDAAVDAGFRKQEVRYILGERAHVRKRNEKRGKLEELGVLERVDSVLEALGDYADTPLGKAAVDRSGEIDSLTN